MNEAELKDLQNKIVEGVKLSAKRLIEKRKKENGQLFYSQNGKVVAVNAVDIKLED